MGYVCRVYPGYSRAPGTIAQVVPRMTAVGQELPVEVVTVNGRISAFADGRTDLNSLIDVCQHWRRYYAQVVGSIAPADIQLLFFAALMNVIVYQRSSLNSLYKIFR